MAPSLGVKKSTQVRGEEGTVGRKCNVQHEQEHTISGFACICVCVGEEPQERATAREGYAICVRCDMM